VPANIVATHARPLPGKMLWGDLRFRTLAAGMAIGLFVQIGLIAHLYNLLARAMGAQAAGFAMGLTTLAAIAGRFVVARALSPGRDRRLAACVSLLVQLAGVLVLCVAGAHQVGWLLIGIVLFGAGIGNATSLPPLIAQAEFTKDDVPRVVALIVGIAQATYAFAPAGFGLVLAIVGGDTARLGPSTAPFFVVAATLQGVAIGSYALGRRRRSPLAAH